MVRKKIEKATVLLMNPQLCCTSWCVKSVRKQTQVGGIHFVDVVLISEGSLAISA